MKIIESKLDDIRPVIKEISNIMKKRYENDNDNDKNIIKNRNNKKLKKEKTTSRSDKYDVNEKI